MTEKIADFFSKYFWFLSAIWLIIFSYFVLLAKYYGPYMDDWSNLYFIQAANEGSATFGLLFEKFYGAHTVALARILLSIEYFVFQGANFLPKAFAFITTFCSFLIFIKNINPLFTKKSDEIFLKIFGLLIVFSASQLDTFSYPWAGFQHCCSLFLSLLALHVFCLEASQKRIPSLKRCMLCFFLAATGSLFTAVGFFGVAIILFGLVLIRAPLKTILIYGALSILLFYCLKPSEIVLRFHQNPSIVAVMSEKVLLQRLGFKEIDFFYGYFRYLFGFSGAIAEFISIKTSLIIGGAVFILFSVMSFFSLYKRRPELIFFQLVLYALLGYAVIAALGRYQTNDHQFIRYVAIYPWLLWSGAVVTLFFFRKTGALLCWVLLAVTALTTEKIIDKQLITKNENFQADINMVNGSFIHMTYHKVSFPLRAFGFQPIYFEDLLKNNRWGIFQHFPPLENDLITSQKCEIIKTKEFVVSEKKFVEYKLDGWNTSKNHYLPYVYALDNQNNIVARGMSIPRGPERLPTNLLPREAIMVYLVIPRSHPLHTLRLLGGSEQSWCEVSLLKKS